MNLINSSRLSTLRLAVMIMLREVLNKRNSGRMKQSKSLIWPYLEKRREKKRKKEHKWKKERIKAKIQMIRRYKEPR